MGTRAVALLAQVGTKVWPLAQVGAGAGALLAQVGSSHAQVLARVGALAVPAQVGSGVAGGLHSGACTVRLVGPVVG